jgi:ribosomal protein S18 acetylase RimI-like enzyme
MTDVTIRKAKRSDIEKLAQLKLQLQQHCEESNSLIWQMTKEGAALLKQKVSDDLDNVNGHVLVAELDGEIIGFAYGEISHRTDYSPGIVGSISTVYVDRKARRKGVGTLLVRQICEFFESEVIEDVTLRYVVGNKEAEIFWSKLGFNPVITTAKTGLRELKREIGKLHVPKKS